MVPAYGGNLSDMQASNIIDSRVDCWEFSRGISVSLYHCMDLISPQDDYFLYPCMHGLGKSTLRIGLTACRVTISCAPAWPL